GRHHALTRRDVAVVARTALRGVGAGGRALVGHAGERSAGLLGDRLEGAVALAHRRRGPDEVHARRAPALRRRADVRVTRGRALSVALLAAADVVRVGDRTGGPRPDRRPGDGGAGAEGA